MTDEPRTGAGALFYLFSMCSTPLIVIEMCPSGKVVNSMKSSFDEYSLGNVISMPVSVRMRWFFAMRWATDGLTGTYSGMEAALADSRIFSS